MVEWVNPQLDKDNMIENDHPYLKIYFANGRDFSYDLNLLDKTPQEVAELIFTVTSPAFSDSVILAIKELNGVNFALDVKNIFDKLRIIADNVNSKGPVVKPSEVKLYD